MFISNLETNIQILKIVNLKFLAEVLGLVWKLIWQWLNTLRPPWQSTTPDI